MLLSFSNPPLLSDLFEGLCIIGFVLAPVPVVLQCLSTLPEKDGWETVFKKEVKPKRKEHTHKEKKTSSS